MKAYTDKEQSKKLAEILLVDTADMRYTLFGDSPWVNHSTLFEEGEIPCWSLAALLDVLNCSFLEEEKGRWYCTGNIHGIIFMHGGDDNAVDACVTTIIKLKEDDLI